MKEDIESLMKTTTIIVLFIIVMGFFFILLTPVQAQTEVLSLDSLISFEPQIVEKTFVLRGLDLFNMGIAIVSFSIGVIALYFSWIFYQSSQKINKDTNEILIKISEKISKIDDIVSNQFNIMFSKLIGAEKYEGKIPISGLQFMKKTKEKKKNRRKKIKK